MSYTLKYAAPKNVNFTVDQHLYQTSTRYRSRVNFIVKLLNPKIMAFNDLESDRLTDIINEERDFILGYN